MALFKLDKFQALAWQAQLGIFAGLAVLLFGVFWYFATGGMRTEVATLSEQVENLKRQNAELQVAQQRVNVLRDNFKMREAQYQELIPLLPEQREITNVLQGLQARARGSNLSLLRFAPKDDAPKDFYVGKPVEVEIASNFGNLQQFFNEMANYQRLVSITDFSLTQTGEQAPNRTLEARFLLTAYYATPEQLNNLTPPAPVAKPGAPGTPMTPPVAAPPAPAQ